MFFKIAVLKKFAILTEKHLRWSLFLIKHQSLRPKGVFLRILRNVLGQESVMKQIQKMSCIVRGNCCETCRNIPQKNSYEWVCQEEFFNKADAF